MIDIHPWFLPLVWTPCRLFGFTVLSIESRQSVWKASDQWCKLKCYSGDWGGGDRNTALMLLAVGCTSAPDHRVAHDWAICLCLPISFWVCLHLFCILNYYFVKEVLIILCLIVFWPFFVDVAWLVYLLLFVLTLREILALRAEETQCVRAHDGALRGVSGHPVLSHRWAGLRPSLFGYLLWSWSCTHTHSLASWEDCVTISKSIVRI